MGKLPNGLGKNRTITVDFQNEATYFQLLDNGKAFLECVLAFVRPRLSLQHKATCRGGGCLTRHSITPVSAWVASRSGGYSAPHVKRCSRSYRTSSCAIARCDRRWPVMRC